MAGFWGLNAGLMGMIMLTLVPVGVLQAIESFQNGFWSARSWEFYQQPVINGLLWLRIVPDTVFILHRARLADLSAQNRLPTMYGTRENVEAGGLMSYGANTRAGVRAAATFVDKIFKGAKPADLPVEQPTKFELVINLKTAKQIGLAIPPSVLYRADKVIK